ncbi:MAG: DNA damage-inducible protein D [Firmicutes bacterium]|nr:DNA damage-inducible protein D [Bacillota bacterium]
MLKSFDNIKHLDEKGNEFWLARELQEVLQYSKWQNFERVIKQAMVSCRVSQQEVNDHFTDVSKTVSMPSGAKPKKIKDYKLTRYACYLITMNGDPRKEVIALGQTYFATKARQQEIFEAFNKLTEDERRLFLRVDIKQKNMLLSEAAKRAGIISAHNFAIFHDFGYRGLYGGEGAKAIARRKGLNEGEDILDHMGSAELAANYFRITQTEEVMSNNNVSTPSEANETHFRVGEAVRKTMIGLGTTLPENMPTPEKSTKELEKEVKKGIGKKKKD